MPSVISTLHSRALCRITLLPVTHVLVDTCMLTVKPAYKLLNVSDDLKWTTNTRDTISTHFQGITNNIDGFGRPFLLLHFFPPPQPVNYISTRPYSFLPVQMTGLYIKLCMSTSVSTTTFGTSWQTFAPAWKYKHNVSQVYKNIASGLHCPSNS